MPQFRITAPDGTVYNVTGPDGATEQDALAQVQSQHAPAQTSAPAPSAAAPVEQPSIMDRLQTNPVIGAPLQTALRAGQGAEQLLVHGAATLGIPGADAAAQYVDKAVSGQNQRYNEARQRVIGASTNPRLTEALTSTGEIMGNMLNPAGMAGNLIKAAPGLGNAALRGAVSGAGFGATQPVTDNPNYWVNKGAQVVSGAALGAGTGAAVEALGPKVPRSSGPSTQELKAAATDAYEASKAAGATIKKDAFDAALTDIEKGAREALTYRPSLQPKAATAIDQIRQEVAQNPGDLSLGDIEVARRIARTALESPEKSTRAVGHYVVDKIDDFVNNLKPEDITGGDAPAAIAALKDARGLYAKSAKSADIDAIVEKAKNAVGANYTAAGFDTALRQKFRAVADNPRAMRRYSPAEQAAILKIVRGSGLQNTLRQVGKIAPTGVIPILSELGAFGGALATDHPAVAAGVLAGAGVGAVARTAASRMGQSNVNALSELARRGQVPSTAPGPAPDAIVWNPLMDLAAKSFAQPRR